MATNLAIDDKLIIEAQAIGGARTKKAVVTEALKNLHSEKKAGPDYFPVRESGLRSGLRL